MAIEILKDLRPTFDVYGYYNGAVQNTYSHQTSFLAGYNLNIIRWRSDTDPTPTEGEIVINDYTFTNLVAQADGEFTFNIQEVVKTLFGKFNDHIDYNTSDVVVYDGNLLLKLSVTVKVKIPGDADETEDITVYALRSVHQIADANGESMVSFDPLVFTTSIYSSQILLKYSDAYIRTVTYKKQQTLKMFKGYPLSISVIDSLLSDNITLELIKRDLSGSAGSTAHAIVPADSDEYIKRLILSDGEHLLSPLDVGSWVLKITTTEAVDVGSESRAIFFLDVEIVDDCGVYLKWLNSEGGWSYYLFNKFYKMPMTSKTKGSINTYTETLIGATGNQSNIGQTTAVGLRVNQRFLSRDEYEQVIEIASSPMVYLFNAPKGTLATADKWLEISLSDFKEDYRDNKKSGFDISFVFTLPNQYAQTL